MAKPTTTGASPEPVPSSDPQYLRFTLAHEVFKIIVSRQIETGKFENEVAGTWAWKYADAFLAASKVEPKPTVATGGRAIIIHEPGSPEFARAEAILNEVGSNFPELNPVQQQILDQSNPKFDPANALLPKP